MSEAVALALLEVEGKLYLNAAEWPAKVYADRVAVKTFDPRRVTWDGQNLKLWLENGNAVYTLAPDDDGKADIVTLHRKVATDVGEVPGHPLPAPEPEPTAPEPIVVATSALEAMGFQRVGAPLVDAIVSPARFNIFGKAIADARGQVGVGSPVSSMPNNFHRLMYPAGGNEAGYESTGNVRYFTAQDSYFTAQDTVPVTPYRDLRHLQAEVDLLRKKLTDAMEIQHTQYLMASPASAALTLESSQSQWRTFLTDVGGYLNFLQGMCQKLAALSYKNAQGEESRVWLTDPLAAQGRLSEFERESGYARQPKEVTLKEMMGEMGRAAELLGGQATTLLGIVPPAPAVKDASLASTLDIDKEAFTDIENAIANKSDDEMDAEDYESTKLRDVLYERNWSDPGNGGSGPMGGDDGG